MTALAVGLLAIYIYKKQQKDNKRSAANTILLEIVSAEKLINDAKIKIGESRRAGVTQIPEHHYVMSMESWNRFKSLFVKDFKKSQWGRISKFYNECQLFDETVAYNDSMFINDTTEIRKNVHKGIYKYVSEYAIKIADEKDETKKKTLIEELKKKKDAIGTILTSAEYMFTYSPSKPVKDIEKYIDTIETNLSIGDVGQN